MPVQRVLTTLLGSEFSTKSFEITQRQPSNSVRILLRINMNQLDGTDSGLKKDFATSMLAQSSSVTRYLVNVINPPTKVPVDELTFEPKEQRWSMEVKENGKFVV